VRILLLDIETSPLLVDAWQLYDVNVSLNQIRDSARMLCFAAKWHGEKKMYFASEHDMGHREMVEYTHGFLELADAVVTYNGDQFDLKHIHREFLLAGLTPPAPYKSIDLLKVVRQQFRFPSNSLAYVSKALGIGAKAKHEGHELWVKCMAGDEDAWKRMRRYNIQDVKLLESLYDQLRPWIKGHPHHGLYGAEGDCPNCGGGPLQRRGFSMTGVGRFQRFQCQGCGTWSRGTRRDAGVAVTQVR